MFIQEQRFCLTRTRETALQTTRFSKEILKLILEPVTIYNFSLRHITALTRCNVSHFIVDSGMVSKDEFLNSMLNVSVLKLKIFLFIFTLCTSLKLISSSQIGKLFTNVCCTKILYFLLIFFSFSQE